MQTLRLHHPAHGLARLRGLLAGEQLGYRATKRALDVVLTSTLLLVLSPVLLVVALLIKLDDPGAPVVFRQPRSGRGGRRFGVLKFRTMVPNADELKEQLRHLSTVPWPDFRLENDPRVTRIGRVLRKTSLDELPQLFNVLRGDMSLVGPRPLIENEDRRVEGRFRDRLSLTPGLTGLWQVNGRSDIPFDEMIKLDYVYVSSWSLWGDVKLLLRTVSAIWRGHGAY